MPTRKKRKLRLWALLTVVFGALALITLAINAFVKPAPVQEGKEKAVANAELPEKSDVTEESEETDTICLSSGDHCNLLISLECPWDLEINSHSGNLNNHNSP